MTKTKSTNDDVFSALVAELKKKEGVEGAGNYLIIAGTICMIPFAVFLAVSIIFVGTLCILGIALFGACLFITWLLAYLPARWLATRAVKSAAKKKTGSTETKNVEANA